MFIDTHCHLNMMVDKKPDEILTQKQIDDLGAVVCDAAAAGVNRIINVGTSLPETQNSLLLAAAYKQVFATAGVHPCDVSGSGKDQLKDLREIVKKERENIVGIGETGLDFYHKPFDADAQAYVFEGHIELALEYGLALVVHVRDAGEAALKILEKYQSEARGVIHCFSLDLAAAYQIASWGDWYIGIDGPVTYPKNDWLREVVATIDLQYQLLETDAPFLTPQSHRGKRNSPVHIPEIARQIAASRGCDIADVAAATTANAIELFGLPAE